MNARDLNFDDQGREKLVSGIKKIAKAVKSTLGPKGNTVLIESKFHTRGVLVTKDGVTVAKSIDLEDPVENLAVNMMKEAADRTATSAGDGTTTAIVLTEALIDSGMRVLKNHTNLNASELVRSMNLALPIIETMLDKMSKKVSGKRLKDIATISSNNDPEIGKLISQTYSKVGKDGVVTVENSQTSETYYEVTNGIKIDRGYTSRLFVNNQKNDECILEEAYVLVSDIEISNILNIENILKPIIQKNKALLIIGNCTQNVINTLGANVIKNNLKFCNIVPPQFGYKSKELLSDIAVSIGAKYFSDDTGDDLSIINMNDLGVVKRVVVGRDNTVIVKDDESNNELVAKRISELKEQIEITTKKSDVDFLRQRIASLSGGIGVIYVGGNSDIEQKERYDRVEDAVCAVRSAIEEGILPGGGLALYALSSTKAAQLKYSSSISNDKLLSLAFDTLNYSFFAPINQILSNAGKTFDEIAQGLRCDVSSNKYIGYNAKTNEFGDVYKMGVVDPTKVTKNALRNAVSVAGTILTTNAILTYKTEKK